MARVRDQQHRYGQHYTPEPVARLLAAFAIRRPDDLVFDPGCGDGRLLKAAINRKLDLGARGKEARIGVFGVDRSQKAITQAALTGAMAQCLDFFDIDPADPKFAPALPEAFDALVANPPYIRQETIGKKDKERIAQRLKADEKALPSLEWPVWSRRSDIYVYFFARAVRFLRVGGRLAYLTAGSWLDSGYGASLRRFLLANFRVIAVLESSVESFFENASVGTAITVLEHQPDSKKRLTNSIRFISLREPLTSLTGRTTAGLLKFISAISSGTESQPGYGMKLVPQSSLSSDETTGPTGWGQFLRADEVFFRILERAERQVKPLSQLARVRYGVKTGANDFFYMQYRSNAFKPLNEVAKVRRGITTGANEFFYLSGASKASVRTDRVQNGVDAVPVEINGKRFRIERRFLSPVIFSLKEIDSIVMNGGGKKLLFNCSDRLRDLRGTGAFAYIKAGEKSGFHMRPTCRGRNPWYSVAARVEPAPLIFPSKVGERWLIGLNRSRVFEDKKLYGIFPANSDELLLAGLLNSTWARYYVEVTCRQMTGSQAIADIDVITAEAILLPDPKTIPSDLRQRIEEALVDLAGRPIVGIFDEIQMEDRRRLDLAVLESLGFTEKHARQEALEALYKAATDLVRKRLTKRNTFV